MDALDLECQNRHFGEIQFFESENSFNMLDINGLDGLNIKNKDSTFKMMEWLNETHLHFQSKSRRVWVSPKNVGDSILHTLNSDCLNTNLLHLTGKLHSCCGMSLWGRFNLLKWYTHLWKFPKMGIPKTWAFNTKWKVRFGWFRVPPKKGNLYVCCMNVQQYPFFHAHKIASTKNVNRKQCCILASGGSGRLPLHFITATTL